MVQRSDPPADPLSIHQLLWRGGATLFTFFGLLLLAGWFLRSPIEAVADPFVREWGPLGLLLVVLAVDCLPLTNEPVLLLAWSGGMEFLDIWLASSTGSVLAGLFSWGVGGRIGRTGVLRDLLRRYRIQGVLERYGGWAIAIAAISPLPYSVTCWAAGASKVPFWPVFFGVMFRFLKVLVYLALTGFGWSASGS